MRNSATLLTDGTPEAAALSKWIRERAPGVGRIDALSSEDLLTVARARDKERRRERLVVLSSALSDEPELSYLSGHEALGVVRGWLAPLDPFEARERGAEIIEAEVRAERDGAPKVLALLRTITPPIVAEPIPKKRGRPKGQSNPFRGAGFDICVALLREPARVFSERALAAEAERSYYAAHRILKSLDERGYLKRDQRGTRLVKRQALRDDLAAAYRARLGTPRSVRYFAAPPRSKESDVREAAFEALRRAGFEPILAGPSALPRELGLIGGPLTLYAPYEAFVAIERAGFRRLRGGAGALAIWPISEKALVSKRVALGEAFATHPIITYLDLIASADPRERELANEIWRAI